METIQLDAHGEQIFDQLARVGENLDNQLQELSGGVAEIRAKLSKLTETAVEFAQLEEMLNEHVLAQYKSGRGVSVETSTPETVTITNQAGETVEVPLDGNGELDVEVRRVHESLDLRPDYFLLLAAPDVIVGFYFKIEDAWYALDKLNQNHALPVCRWTVADFRHLVYGDNDCTDDTPLLEYWNSVRGCEGLQL